MDVLDVLNANVNRFTRQRHYRSLTRYVDSATIPIREQKQRLTYYTITLALLLHEETTNSVLRRE